MEFFKPGRKCLAAEAGAICARPVVAGKRPDTEAGDSIRFRAVIANFVGWKTEHQRWPHLNHRPELPSQAAHLQEREFDREEFFFHLAVPVYLERRPPRWWYGQSRWTSWAD